MSITEGLTSVTHFTDNNDGSFTSRYQIRPLPGSIAKEIITNYAGEDDIDDLIEGNDFYDDATTYPLWYDNDFNNEV